MPQFRISLRVSSLQIPEVESSASVESDVSASDDDKLAMSQASCCFTSAFSSLRRRLAKVTQASCVLSSSVRKESNCVEISSAFSFILI
jgi:hypothetical protein